jgi:hypothetical protein
MTHTTTQRFIVTIQPMNGWDLISSSYGCEPTLLSFESLNTAYDNISYLCDKYNIENWDGKEGGGVGYDVRITLEII